MEYTIWKINDSRDKYVKNITDTIELKRVHTLCVDGSKSELVDRELSIRGLEEKLSYLNTRGELGVWLTFINAMEYCVERGTPLLTIEDDAVLGDRFMQQFYERFRELPRDFDFFSLFIPRDHHHWAKFAPEMDENGFIINGEANYVGPLRCRVTERLFKPWQRYGGVSMLWSPAGAKKVLDLIQTSVFGQWDEYVYASSRTGKLKGFTSNPDLPDLVYIRSEEQSLVH